MKNIAQAFFLISIFFIAFTSTRVFGMPLSWFLSVGAILFILATEFLLSKQPGSINFIGHSWKVSAALILLGGILSLQRSIDNISNMKEVFQAVWTLFIVPPVLMLVMRRWSRGSLWVLVLGISLNSAIAVWDKLTQMGVGAFLAGIVVTSKGISIPITLYTIPTLFFTYNRYAGALSHPNALGQISITGFSIVLASILIVERKRSILKLFLLILLLVIIYWSNILSGSISGFIGINIAGCVIVFGAIFRKPTYKKLMTFCLLLLLVVLLVFVYKYNKDWTSAISGWGTSNYDRVYGTTGPLRLQLIRHALTLILENPIIGYGMDLKSGQYYFKNDLPSTSNYAYYNDNVVVHNGLLWAWLGGGLFAFIGTLIAYYFAIRLSLRHIFLFFYDKSNYIMLALAAATLGWVFVDMIQPTFFMPYTWISAFLLAKEIKTEL